MRSDQRWLQCQVPLSQCGQNLQSQLPLQRTLQKRCNRSHFKRCSCGRNKNSDNPCDGSKKLRSRCNCYNENRGCSDECTCRNCVNPKGQKKAVPAKKRAKKDTLAKYSRPSSNVYQKYFDMFELRESSFIKSQPSRIFLMDFSSSN